ncbi:efflux RND transporter periplasmic adaptor subunit [Motilimonas eburnea]|uniref:efflux RND transporter periplasmic adaptor subunit n=1 Tax=Motilimonas eburnea TaxID=1737488 RepID=UPI001E29FDF4|nr:efflux RND transporter periplasmic adaptor subunit [Motilimonas eburnea]MCE2570487.1 efflux RND transporter periplasmic adaptor subunit [Motilimonas eburnea]
MKVSRSFKKEIMVLMWVLPLVGCEKAAVSQDITAPIKPVKTLIVNHKQYQIRHFTGVIEANKTIDMNFRIQGELTDLPIKSGQHVEKGQLLAQLDDHQQRINKKSRGAALKQAKAEYQRGLKLNLKNVISESNLELLESQYISAQAAYEQSLEDLEYTSLIAPFNGVVSQRHVDNFTKVTASTKVLTLQDVQQYRITITVPQSQFVRLQSARDVKLSANIEGISKPLQLEIDELSISQQSSQQLQVSLVMQPPLGHRLFTGTTVKVTAEAVGMAQTVVLPSHTVLSHGQGHYVFIVDPETNVLKQRAVTVAGMSEQGITISNGLLEGERVVVAGVSQVREGQQVSVEDK